MKKYIKVKVYKKVLDKIYNLAYHLKIHFEPIMKNLVIIGLQGAHKDQGQLHQGQFHQGHLHQSHLKPPTFYY